ncbi:MerR family transcriptional regulator [Denitrificimonas caeni]|uniref:MerR family transcriptional regulator n=1 Tax=Denitrificimonas caeni TaxID=521720 RepID=UPI001964A692|nr:MerR family transcriptional regulator [Denitrificimonas caeni]
MSDAIDQNALYPIREVARLTGVNPITLRAWERRYQLIEPVRTESGHRLYSQEHIDFLHETLRLMAEGVPISRIKAVISESPPRAAQVSALVSENDSSQLLEKIRLAASQLQVQVLERQLDRLFADYSLNPMRALLADIEQQLQQQKNHDVALAFWRSTLTRRLQVRLHALYSQQVLPSKRIVIQKAAQTPEYLAKLVALFCFEQGYQPLEFDQSMTLEPLLDAARPFAIQAVLFIDDSVTATTQWTASFKKYAALRTWVFGSDALAELQPPSVNCELRVCSQWFAPLNL